VIGDPASRWATPGQVGDWVGVDGNYNFRGDFSRGMFHWSEIPGDGRRRSEKLETGNLKWGSCAVLRICGWFITCFKSD